MTDTDRCDEPDSVVLAGAEREMQESFDKALIALRAGRPPSELFEAAGDAEPQLMRLDEKDLRFIGSFELRVPARMSEQATHYVYRNRHSGVPHVLSAGKRVALERLGWVQILAMRIDPEKKRRQSS